MLNRRLLNGVPLSIMAALCWAALTENQGWLFFLPLWLLILFWLQFSPVTLLALRLSVLPGFMLFFFWQLVLGAFDVGWRALAPGRHFAPGWQHYPSRLSQPASQRLLATMISLLPGTCSARIEQQSGQPNQILVHVLDQQADWQASIAALEQQLARLLLAENREEFPK